MARDFFRQRQAHRRGQPEDVDAIVEIEESAFDDPWTEKAIASELKSSEGLVLVLGTEGAPFGWCCLRVAGGEAELLRLAIHLRKQRQGHGKGLLEAGLKEVQRRGAERVFLEVREDNSAAQSLYQEAGFQQVGRRPRYYRDGVAAAILSLDL